MIQTCNITILLRFDACSTLVQRTFDCLSKVIKFTVTWPASHSHADLWYWFRPQWSI